MFWLVCFYRRKLLQNYFYLLHCMGASPLFKLIEKILRWIWVIGIMVKAYMYKCMYVYHRHMIFFLLVGKSQALILLFFIIKNTILVTLTYFEILPLKIEIRWVSGATILWRHFLFNWFDFPKVLIKYLIDFYRYLIDL